EDGAADGCGRARGAHLVAGASSDEFGDDVPGPTERLQYADHGAAIGLRAKTLDDDLGLGFEAHARSLEVGDLGRATRSGANGVAHGEDITLTSRREVSTAAADEDRPIDHRDGADRNVRGRFGGENKTRAEPERERDGEDHRR